MKYIIRIVPFLLLLFLLTSCAQTKEVRHFPWPEFDLIEIGDMLCAPTLEDRMKFDAWLEKVDKYREEVNETN